MSIGKVANKENFSGKFLKDRANILTKPTTEICNISTKYLLFPINYLTAKFQKDSTALSKNYYRPISLLPLMCGIIEKVIQGQTQAF